MFAAKQNIFWKIVLSEDVSRSATLWDLYLLSRVATERFKEACCSVLVVQEKLSKPGLKAKKS